MSLDYLIQMETDIDWPTAYRFHPINPTVVAMATP